MGRESFPGQGPRPKPALIRPNWVAHRGHRNYTKFELADQLSLDRAVDRYGNFFPLEYLGSVIFGTTKKLAYDRTVDYLLRDTYFYNITIQWYG